MSSVKFLLDEHVARSLGAAIVRMDASITVARIGGSGMPDFGTSDPALLEWAEAHGFAIVTRDKSTMPGHVAEFIAAGHHTFGVFILRDGTTLKAIAETLVLIHSASLADEWRDQIGYLPFA